MRKFLFAALLSFFAPDGATGQLITAQSYRQWSEDERLLYFAGFLDAVVYAATIEVLGLRIQLADSDTMDPFISRVLFLRDDCVPPRGWTHAQSFAVIDRYTEAHPEEWHLSTGGVFARALREAWCPGF